MKRISQGKFTLVIFSFLAIAMMVPVALVKSEAFNLDFDRSDPASARLSIETSSSPTNVTERHTGARSREMPGIRGNGSGDSEREDSADFSDQGERDREDRASWQSMFPDDRLDPTREWMSIPEVTANRSVVGWNDASISNLQPQERIAPASLEIPSLSINAIVDPVSVRSDGAMEIPEDRDTVGWYRHGAAPGDPGSTVIAGHLDSADGRSVFFDLQTIELGATVRITLEDGSEAIYRVFEKVSYPSDDLPSKTIFTREGDPVLALLTCGGQWDRDAGRYTETVVVYAEPVDTE